MNLILILKAVELGERTCPRPLACDDQVRFDLGHVISGFGRLRVGSALQLRRLSAGPVLYDELKLLLHSGRNISNMTAGNRAVL